MSRLTNRSAIEICAICNTANKSYVKVIETCRKTVFVQSQLTCINTYIKYVTEMSHKKIINYVKSTLASIVGAEQFTGPWKQLNRKKLLNVRQIIRKIDQMIEVILDIKCYFKVTPISMTHYIEVKKLFLQIYLINYKVKAVCNQTRYKRMLHSRLCSGHTFVIIFWKLKLP